MFSHLLGEHLRQLKDIYPKEFKEWKLLLKVEWVCSVGNTLCSWESAIIKVKYFESVPWYL